jgi:hypothetical protein
MTRRRWIPFTIAATILAGLAVALVATSQRRRNELETPVYTVVSKQEGFEIRRYEPRLVAEVMVAGEAEEATDAGFRILFDFIFGNNATGTEIAMTTPVERQSRGEGDEWVIRFTMPSQYSIATLPAPNDERVMIREIPSKTYGALRFPGAPRESLVRLRTRKFMDRLEAAGLSPSGEPSTYARYDPPWTLWFLRRNEILVELALSGD